MDPTDSSAITTARLLLVPVATDYAADIFREFTPEVTRYMFPKSPEHLGSREPELGIWIKTSAHGHKYGREAVAGLKTWAESHLDYDHLIYPADEHNIASRKITESLGGVVTRDYDHQSQSGATPHVVEYRMPRTA